MKKVEGKYKRIIKKIFPIFVWRKCFYCGVYFRFEWGYKIIRYYNKKIYYYACNKCGEKSF